MANVLGASKLTDELSFWKYFWKESTSVSSSFNGATLLGVSMLKCLNRNKFHAPVAMMRNR